MYPFKLRQLNSFGENLPDHNNTITLLLSRTDSCSDKYYAAVHVCGV